MQNLKQTDRVRKPTGYEWLKKINPSHNLVVEYEKFLKSQPKDEFKGIAEYEKKVFTPEPEPTELKPLDCEFFYQEFKMVFELLEGRPFDENANNGEGRIFAKTIILYLAKSNKFLKSPLISNKTRADINKGLMIVGKWGNGKTSILKTIYEMLLFSQKSMVHVKDIEGNLEIINRYRMGFKMFSSNLVVDDYEGCNNPDKKLNFWNVHTSGFNLYDDVMTEREVSNYGKFEVFKDILEKRNFKNLKTILTMNYSSGTDLDETLTEMGLRYGNRIYDRIYSDFTIIELKGKSLRN